MESFPKPQTLIHFERFFLTVCLTFGYVWLLLPRRMFIGSEDQELGSGTSGCRV